MTIKFLRVILLLCLCTSYASSEIVNKITVLGNKRITSETIKVLGNVSTQKNLEKNDLNNILKKLYETNFFDDIKLSLESGELIINVIENPIIDNIEIIGIKNKTFIKEISDIIVLKNRMSFTEIQLQKDINIIKNILKSNGFYFAKVEPLITKNEELNSVNLRINIDQGKKARIKQIQFIGDKKIKDKKLLEIIASEEHKFWKFISKNVYLNQPLIDLDKRLLESFYKNLGYYKVKVLNSFAELTEEDSFKLIFNIDAGKKYKFNNFTLSLPEDYNEADFTKVEKIFEKLKDEDYSLNDISKILTEIDRIASLRLYDFITADVQETIVADNKIDFDFKIMNSQKFYVERINIIGNYQTMRKL